MFLLQNLFPNNAFIQNQLAVCYYNLHEYELSIECFEKLFQIDPLRYEGIDIYSNILFIKENLRKFDRRKFVFTATFDGKEPLYID